MESLLSSALASERPRSVVGRPPNKPRCVLLAGSARGGTSWALKVLDSHPAVQGCHEPFYQLSHDEMLGQLCDRVKAGNGTSADAEILMDLWMHASIQTNKPPFFEKSFLKTPAWLRKAAWMSARAYKPMSSAFSYLASGEMNEQHCIVIKNRPFPLLDKILEVIHADALILLRHPCGVVSSWLRGMRMGVMQAASANPTEVWNRYSNYIEPLGFSENDLMKMSPAGLLAINWLVDTALFSHYENSPTMKTKVMVYCNMVRNPVQEWSKVFEWLHLPFDSSVEAFLNQSSKPGFDMRQLLGKKYNYFSVQRGEKSPLDSWRKDLRPDEIREVMSIVTPHFSVEKYWPDSPS